MSGINYLLNRLHTYPTTEKAKDAEMNTIKTYYVVASMTQTYFENCPLRKTKHTH
jgi:hypothetical protein